MFIRKSLFAAMIAVVCMFTSCTHEEEQKMEITLPIDKYSTKVKGVEINVSPKYLKVGDKVLIDIEHEDGDAVEVIISSLSLSLRDTVTTPYLTEITMDSVGLYGISFEVDGESPDSPAIIRVTE